MVLLTAISLLLTSFMAFEQQVSSLVPFVIPPPIPKSNTMARDQPLMDDDGKSAFGRRMKDTGDSDTDDCPPDCTEGSDCSTACKCKNSYAAVDEMCNPPLDYTVVPQCDEWYSDCPMYKPLHY